MSLREIETGDPKVHASKVAKGARYWRWTVIRHAAPAKRPCGNGRLWFQRRVLVQCVCGDERIAWEVDLTRGLSTGCRSATCRRAYDEAIMSKIRDAAEMVAERIKGLQALLETERGTLEKLHAESLEIAEQSRKRKRAG